MTNKGSYVLARLSFVDWVVLALNEENKGSYVYLTFSLVHFMCESCSNTSKFRSKSSFHIYNSLSSLFINYLNI